MVQYVQSDVCAVCDVCDICAVCAVCDVCATILRMSSKYRMSLSRTTETVIARFELSTFGYQFPVRGELGAVKLGVWVLLLWKGHPFGMHRECMIQKCWMSDNERQLAS